MSHRAKLYATTEQIGLKFCGIHLIRIFAMMFHKDQDMVINAQKR